MSLLEYCYETIKVLENCNPKEFAALYVARKSEAYRLYSQGLIVSTAHGIDFFANVIKYFDNPDSYKETKTGKEEYETNFREILNRNYSYFPICAECGSHMSTHGISGSYVTNGQVSYDMDVTTYECLNCTNIYSD